jgi:glucosamine-6-phosphate deaminase
MSCRTPGRPFPVEATIDPHWFSRPPHGLSVLDRDAIARAAAKCLARALIDGLAARQHVVLVASAGRTPLGTYAVLRRSFRSSVNWSRVICVQMDEYADLGSTDPRALAAEIRHELIEPLGVGQFIGFFDAGGAPICSLNDYEDQLRRLGGIDVAVHGIGRNGHIGFNEPSSTRGCRTRRVILAASTRLANGVAFRNAVTLGPLILSQARVAIVLLIGAEKQGAADALLFGTVGPHNPAAYLRACARVSVFLDPPAVPAALAALDYAVA